MGLIQAINLGTVYTLEPSMVRREMGGVSRVLIGPDQIDVIEGKFDGIACRAIVAKTEGWPDVLVMIPMADTRQIADALAGLSNGGVEVVRDLGEWLKG